MCSQAATSLRSLSVRHLFYGFCNLRLQPRESWTFHELLESGQHLARLTSPPSSSKGGCYTSEETAPPKIPFTVR